MLKHMWPPSSGKCVPHLRHSGLGFYRSKTWISYWTYPAWGLSVDPHLHSRWAECETADWHVNEQTVSSTPDCTFTDWAPTQEQAQVNSLWFGRVHVPALFLLLLQKHSVQTRRSRRGAGTKQVPSTDALKRPCHKKYSQTIKTISIC